MKPRMWGFIVCIRRCADHRVKPSEDQCDLGSQLPCRTELRTQRIVVCADSEKSPAAFRWSLRHGRPARLQGSVQALLPDVSQFRRADERDGESRRTSNMSFVTPEQLVAPLQPTEDHYNSQDMSSDGHRYEPRLAHHATTILGLLAVITGSRRVRSSPLQPCRSACPDHLQCVGTPQARRHPNLVPVAGPENRYPQTCR